MVNFCATIATGRSRTISAGTGAAPSDEAGISLAEFLWLLWRRRLWLACALAAGVGSAVAALHFLPPVYRAEALVLIEPRSSPVSEEAGGPSLDPDSATVDSQVEVLASRSFARKVVARLTGAKEGGAEPDLEAQAERLLGRLEVARQGKTRVIAVRVRDSDPLRAAEIANTLVETYLVDQLAGKFAAVSRAAGWFADKLRDLEGQLAEAETRAVAFREANAHLFDTALAHVEDRLADLERQHLLATADRKSLEAKLSVLRERARQNGLETAALGTVTPLLSRLEAAEADLVRREAELRGLYGERHPLLAEILREKEELGRRIDRERRAVLARFEADLAEARARERTLAEALERIRRIAADARRAELEKRRLEREVELQRQLYEAFAGRFESASDVERVEQPDARVIAEAVPPSAPVFPQPRVVLPVGVVTGLGLGLIGLFVREKLDRTLVTTRDVRRELGLATLAFVPELPRRRAKRLPPHDHVVEHPRSRLAEALREILAGLSEQGGSPGGRLVLLASAMPGEGKSTIALGLGRLAALEGLRTLLVDGDLRKPGLAGLMGVRPGAGFGEVLEGSLPLAEVLQRDPATDLDLLPGSARHVRPTRLLAPDRLRCLFEALRATYDLVLIDSAPLAAVADTRMLAPQVDDILFVLRWHVLPAPVARDAIDGLGTAAGKLRGAVLSRVDAPTCARYGDAGAGRLAARLASYYNE